jgi:cation diffusion facilitator CzcD-associated flavoprotein CzcO
MAAEVIPAPKSEVIEPIIDSEQTTCCVVGGGPGGMMLSLLLARKGVPSHWWRRTRILTVIFAATPSTHQFWKFSTK